MYKPFHGNLVGKINKAAITQDSNEKNRNLPHKIRQRIDVQPCKLGNTDGAFHNDHHQQHWDGCNYESPAGLISIPVVRWKEYTVKDAIDHQPESKPGNGGVNAHRIVFYLKDSS